MIYEPTTTDDDWRIDTLMTPFRLANEIWLKLHPIQFDRVDLGDSVLWSARVRYGFGIGYGNRDDHSSFVVPPL